MNELSKLSHLLQHRVEHNREHAETYREWAERAAALGAQPGLPNQCYGKGWIEAMVAGSISATPLQ
ncbi:MAG: hypothetical protein M1508_09475 [Nitrospirae bacterium]|nr:hypothetical protein [Nitrospirota bacterium]MCL5422783.1 hypothetical protein [Nitrospirota bacterium]